MEVSSFLLEFWLPATIKAYEPVQDKTYKKTCNQQRLRLACLFVCVEVLRPSQPNGVMSSVVSLPNHTFTGQA